REVVLRGQTVVSFETESDMFDYDATAGVEIWHRQMTVCTWRASPADAVCTARVPFGLRAVYFTLPDTHLSSPDHWNRTVRATIELFAIAIVRRDGTVRLRARVGPLDNLSSWFGWRCGIGDDVTLPWDPTLLTEASDPLRAEWDPAW